MKTKMNVNKIEDPIVIVFEGSEPKKQRIHLVDRDTLEIFVPASQEALDNYVLNYITDEYDAPDKSVAVYWGKDIFMNSGIFRKMSHGKEKWIKHIDAVESSIYKALEEKKIISFSKA